MVCFAASNHDIIVFYIEKEQAYKEFTLKAEHKAKNKLTYKISRKGEYQICSMNISEYQICKWK